jgi:hypothetical protein
MIDFTILDYVRKTRTLVFCLDLDDASQAILFASRLNSAIAGQGVPHFSWRDRSASRKSRLQPPPSPHFHQNHPVTPVLPHPYSYPMASLEEPVYVPSDPENKNVEKFRRAVNQKRGINLAGYQDLHAYSVHPDTFLDFWQDVWEYVGIKASKLSPTVISAFQQKLTIGYSTERQTVQVIPPSSFLSQRTSQFRGKHVCQRTSK